MAIAASVPARPASSLDRAGRFAGRRLSAALDDAALLRTNAADRGAAKGLWRRFRPLLAARGPALRRPLGAQLGDRRFHRSRRPDRTRRRSRRRRRRPQSAARAVRRPSRRLQPLFAEQPAVSQSALYRRRKTAGISACAFADKSDALARLRASDIVDYAGVAEPEMARAALRVRCLQDRSRSRAPAGFREVSRRARAVAVALRLLRGAAAQIRQAVVGMAGRMATARRGQMRRLAPGRRMPPKSSSSNSCNGPPTGSCRPASDLAAQARHEGRALSRRRRRRAVRRLRCLERADRRFRAISPSARRRIRSTPPVRTGASPASMPPGSSFSPSSRTATCCAPRCATPARSGSTMCSA